MKSSFDSKILNDMQFTVDSRSVADPANTVFAALRTGLGDGHKYIKALYDKGVRHFIAEHAAEDCPEASFLISGNVCAELQQLAARRLADCGSRVVAITGSVGKTTMKELLYTALLSRNHAARRSPRSWNSRIGLPLAVLDMTRASLPEADTIIVEAGIDAPGQGDRIAAILGKSARLGIITPVTDEHDEAFASHADKIKEKIRIVSSCPIIIYADSDPELKSTLEVLQATDGPRRLIPVTQGSHPTIYHALTAAALKELGADIAEVDSLPTANKRREVAAGSYGNTIFRDFFTPDYRSLQDALDFVRRQASPLQPTALLCGELIGSDRHSDAEIKALAALYGFGIAERITPEVLADIHRGDRYRNMQILLFGAGGELFDAAAEALESAGHRTTLEVDLDALAHNFNHYRSLVPAGTGIVAMVKASAYGMGAIETGKALQSIGAAYLAVAVIEEGIALREAGITMPVMVLNPVTNRYPALFAHRLEPAVFSADELRRLISEAERAGVAAYPVHIKLDTGMHRVGFTAEQLEEVPQILRATGAVRVESVFSHLATADCLDMDDYTRGQLNCFKAMTDGLRSALGYPFKRHILNTAGMMRFADFGPYEMARLGIGLYGISPYDGPDGAALRPVATFRSNIISLKHWPAGTPVGYGCKGRTRSDDAVIATVPVGYADGINRRFGNGAASFVVRGVECPTIGNICMDLCMIDVTAVPGVAVGDTVEIFGPEMPVERLAQVLGTIPYEVLTSVSPRVKRVYVKR